MKKSFSKSIILTLLIFESISLILILGILYGILSTTIDHDFNKSLKIRQTEISTGLHDRFNFIEMKLRELSSNNSLRVSMLLGMEGQVKELIEEKFPHEYGTFFFVKDIKNNQFIPSLPEYLAPSHDEIDVLTQTENLKDYKLHNLANNRYCAVLSMPIEKKNKILGSACVIFDLSRDQHFWNRLYQKGVTNIFIKDNDNLVNLINGEISLVNNTPPNTVLLDLNKFPNMYCLATSLPLKQKKDNLIFILVGICFFTFLFTMILSLLISRNVCNPLKSMVDQALRIAQNPTNSSMLDEDIRYIEFQKLAHSFNKVLANLFKAQKTLKNHTDNLEEMITQRTAELLERNKQLQKEIIEKKQAEKIIKESEEKYRSLFENNLDGVVLVDMERHIEEANQAFLDMLGYTIEEIESLNFKDITPEKWSETDKDFINNQILKNGYAKEYEKELIKKDGTIFPVTLSAWLFKDKNGNPFKIQAHVRDITERKKMESEILKTSKLDSVGLLAGGIAHDFNNLLTAILGNIALAMFDLESGNHDVGGILKNAETAALHAKDLSTQLLTFSKGGAPIRKTTSVVDIIRESTSFALKGANVNCIFNIDDNISSVKVDPGQISQVINNLIINAIQAMPKGGTISISCKDIEIDPISNSAMKPGSYIQISLQDQGVGIEKENIEKVFDPYFTTKESGSGLGLATCYSIITKHDGYIFVESTKNVGTTFHIYLPSSKLKAEKHQQQTDSVVTGKGKILVMDDEQIVRKTMGAMLRRLGYEPYFAKDGEEAIHLYNQSLEADECFDVVIMDLTIPGGMGGSETIQKLLKIHDEVRAIVSSGYSNDPIMSDYKKYGFKGVAPKPVDIKELSVTLNSILNHA